MKMPLFSLRKKRAAAWPVEDLFLGFLGCWLLGCWFLGCRLLGCLLWGLLGHFFWLQVSWLSSSAFVALVLVGSRMLSIIGAGWYLDGDHRLGTSSWCCRNFRGRDGTILRYNTIRYSTIHRIVSYRVT